jgi:transcriptional regulator with XRE-family HTH domain
MFNRKKIEHYMNLKDWTKYRLAKEAGIGQSTLHEILSGKKTSPNANTLSKIAAALNVRVDDFFDGDPIVHDSGETEEDFLNNMSEENRILFKKVKDLSPEDAKKVLDIIRIFEKESSQ